MDNKLNALISLHKGYGLGDAVQMSAVLKHVRKYRPEWIIDYQAEEGRHQVGVGIAHKTFAFGTPYPTERYDVDIQMLLFDTWHGYTDRPNTRVSSCLKERFGLDWDEECGRYQVNVSNDARRSAKYVMHDWIPNGQRAVAVHYMGDSSPAQKNLSDDQAGKICDCIIKLGRTPLLLDWRDVSPLAGHSGVRTTGGTGFSRWWGGCAEMNTAVISQCEAFVGIDSGPAKCASAIDVPSLVVWTGHHPAPFHDPAPNTTHLVPEGVHQLPPICGNRAVMDWFDAHYNFRTYRDDPIPEVTNWLRKALV